MLPGAMTGGVTGVQMRRRAGIIQEISKDEIWKAGEFVFGVCDTLQLSYFQHFFSV